MLTIYKCRQGFYKFLSEWNLTFADQDWKNNNLKKAFKFISAQVILLNLVLINSKTFAVEGKCEG